MKPAESEEMMKKNKHKFKSQILMAGNQRIKKKDKFVFDGRNLFGNETNIR